MERRLLMVCASCGHEYIRKAHRKIVLPCSRCAGRIWDAYALERGELAAHIEIPDGEAHVGSLG